ncbi:MAG: hypothetical protein GY713_20130 [Actinomycetia bacterium]|nr:hypothetical protein [Actinomycetes bacterium]
MSWPHRRSLNFAAPGGVARTGFASVLTFYVSGEAEGSVAPLTEWQTLLEPEECRHRRSRRNRRVSFDCITNRGEFFSNHYLDAVLGYDLGDLRKQWDEAEAVGRPTPRSGLKAPWFGLQLRDGNRLIGCRRATWRASQIGDRPWAKIKKGEVQPPVDRSLTDGPLGDDEIHHFLLPGHGWAAVADPKDSAVVLPALDPDGLAARLDEISDSIAGDLSRGLDDSAGRAARTGSGTGARTMGQRRCGRSSIR